MTLHPLSWIALVSLSACAGGPLATTLSGNSASPAPDVFTCLRRQIKVAGFSQDSYDDGELRVTAHRYNEKARRPDVQFRRLVDRLSFDVTPGASGAVTTISAQAKTFAERETHRGPTEEQERTSDSAKLAARAILNRCGGQS